MFNTKESIKAKIKIQTRILEISKTWNFLLLNLCTGSGKTLASLKVAETHNDKKWLILCKESAHIEEWEKEIIKHKVKLNYEIICYASLHKVKGSYNIICDEAHALTMSKRLLIKKNIKYNKILFLSATLPKNKYSHLKVLSNDKYKVLSLNLDQAVNLGVLPTPIINIYKLSMSVYQEQKYNKINDAVLKKSDIYNDAWTQKNYDALMYVSTKRKEIVANFKIQAVKQQLQKLNKNKIRYICFCNSIKQLEILKNDSNYYIHSKRNSEKKNQEIIEEFNKELSNHLFTVKMLTESANLTNPQQGILVQVDKEPLTTDQKIGRILRANIPIISLYCIKGTIDEGYLENSLQNINKKYINYYES